MGLEERDTGFGETLAVWGANEGAYLVLPVLGPSTERDTAGLIVDALTKLGLCIKHPRWATKKIILFTYDLRFSQSLENCGIPRQERSHFVPKWGQGAW